MSCASRGWVCARVLMHALLCTHCCARSCAVRLAPLRDPHRTSSAPSTPSGEAWTLVLAVLVLCTQFPTLMPFHNSPCSCYAGDIKGLAAVGSFLLALKHLLTVLQAALAHDHCFSSRVHAQFFRAADTIGLGVGCVGAGPLVLLLQLALGVGPHPNKWQWIAMYEVAAGEPGAAAAAEANTHAGPPTGAVARLLPSPRNVPEALGLVLRLLYASVATFTVHRARLTGACMQ